MLEKMRANRNHHFHSLSRSSLNHTSDMLVYTSLQLKGLPTRRSTYRRWWTGFPYGSPALLCLRAFTELSGDLLIKHREGFKIALNIFFIEHPSFRLVLDSSSYRAFLFYNMWKTMSIEIKRKKVWVWESGWRRKMLHWYCRLFR